MHKKQLLASLLFLLVSSWLNAAFSQNHFQIIKLPKNISGVNEEFSGMAMWQNRVYLEPQYGSHKETKLESDFNIYSINADSIGRAIDGKDTALTAYKIIKVANLNKLPDSVKRYYEGFEAITIVNKQVYLSIETSDTYAYCFLLRGTLDTSKNEIVIDAQHFITLKRPLFIHNAGFESVTYLPGENKLIAYYEFNASPKGGMGYLIDTAFKHPPQPITVPHLYFRITDITATKTDQIYGINYFWNGDYDYYLNNQLVNNQEANIKNIIPNLRDSINNNANYLTEKNTTYARIVTLKNYKDTVWHQVALFPGFKNNWEGLTLYRKGALIITDANRSSKQLTTFAYVKF